MRKGTGGFTLLELVVVTGLIGLLVVAGLTSYTNSQRRSRDAKRKTDIETFKQALELYRSDIGNYPAYTGQITSASALGTALSPYISTSNFPQDPQINLGPFYYYQQNPGGGGSNTYRICGLLESPTSGVDPTCPNAAQDCSTQSGTQACNYGFSQP